MCSSRLRSLAVARIFRARDCGTDFGRRSCGGICAALGHMLPTCLGPFCTKKRRKPYQPCTLIFPFLFCTVVHVSHTLVFRTHFSVYLLGSRKEQAMDEILGSSFYSFFPKCHHLLSQRELHCSQDPPSLACLAPAQSLQPTTVLVPFTPLPCGLHVWWIFLLQRLRRNQGLLLLPPLPNLRSPLCLAWLCRWWILLGEVCILSPTGQCLTD